jgi:aldehyde dehydrogenase (NAD+)
MEGDPADVIGVLRSTRQAAQGWRLTPVPDRLRIVRRARRAIATSPKGFASDSGTARSQADTLVTEVLPLLEAARFLEREAASLLAPRRLGRRGRPAWLAGVHLELRREPCGVVLIVAPGNYPLLLPGVQILQALVAGNGVCVKPAPDCAAPMRHLAEVLRRAGLPAGVLAVLADDLAEGQAAVRAGFDRIVLTGSAETGLDVLRAAAETLTPCTMELSGDDPVFVLPGADPGLAAAAVAYGTRLNDGRTCIAPRRVFALAEVAPEIGLRLRQLCSKPPPVIAVRDMDEALDRAAESPCGLGAAVFGPEADARALAARIDVGCVVVNDTIVPTADPRLPFGGRRRSGFGVTRGAEGLLELTVVKAIAVRRGRFRPHLDPPRKEDAAFFAALIATLHAQGPVRFAALRAMAESIRRRWSR